MDRTCSLLALSMVGSIVLGAVAAEPQAEPKTLLSERGQLLFADKLDQPLGKDWRAAKGRWEVVAGVIKCTELNADMHGAVARRVLNVHNVVIQYSFKLEGARQTTLSINDDKGHCCRVLINPAGFTVQKDSHDKNVSDKVVVLDRATREIKPGVWHTIVIEILGKEMLARLDGDAVAFGAHEAIDVKKANLGLTVAGASVYFKDLRVWDATPNKDWPATKAKLLANKPKA